MKVYILIFQAIVALNLTLVQKCSFFTNEENFKAGIAIADVTPKVGVSLSGILQKYGAIKEVLDPLKVRALAMNDGKKTFIMVVGDVCVISGEIIEKAKLLAFKKTGIPTSQMLVAATHTHAAPRVADWNVNEFDEEYYNLFAEQIAGVIQKSIENMVPAQAGFGIIKKPNYLQNRRWIMKPGTIPPNPFGDTTDQVVMGGHPIENRVKPAGPVDPDLTVLSIQYANGSPLAVLANYGIHYGINEPGSVSADYFGQFCYKLESELISNDESNAPFMAIMSNGASGDIENLGGDRNDIDAFTSDLVNEVSQLCLAIKYNKNINIDIKEVDLLLAVDKPDSNRIKWAKNVLSNSEEHSEHRWTRIFAQEALFLDDFPDSLNVKLQVAAIGDLGIAALPGEIFAETGILIKKDSPYKATFVISHSNEWHGYLPPPQQHLYGGMEVWRRRASYLEVNSTTKMRNKLTDMFSEVYSNQ